MTDTLTNCSLLPQNLNILLMWYKFLTSKMGKHCLSDKKFEIDNVLFVTKYSRQEIKHCAISTSFFFYIFKSYLYTKLYTANCASILYVAIMIVKYKLQKCVPYISLEFFSNIGTSLMYYKILLKETNRTNLYARNKTKARTLIQLAERRKFP